MTPEQRRLLERKRELLLKKKELLSRQGPSVKVEPIPKRESFDVPGPQPITTRVGPQYKPSDAYLSELRGTTQRMASTPIPIPSPTQPAHTPQSTYAAPSGGDPMPELEVTPEKILYWTGPPGSSHWTGQLGPPPQAAVDMGAGALNQITLGLLDFMPEAKERPGYMLGSVGTMAIPWLAALKGAQAVPWLARLAQKAPTLGRMARGAIAGSAVGGTKNVISAAKGEGFNVGEVGADIVAGTVFEGLGGIPKTLARRARRAVSKVNKAAAEVYKSNDPSAALTVNYGTRACGPVPSQKLKRDKVRDIYLDALPVRRDELRVMMGIPQQPMRTTPTGIKEGVKQTIEKGTPDWLRTGQRMHEEYGTTEVMYRPVQEAWDVAARNTNALKDEFRGLLKQSIPFSQRTKVSERVALYAFSRQGGGLKILKAMGHDEVPTLTAKETHLYDYMRNKMDDFFVEINRSRIASGISSFPKQENYFTFFRTLQGEIEKNGHTLLSVPAKKFSATAQATSFRFSRKRILDDYGPLDLDAFGIFEKYSGSAYKHIHLSPAMAKCNQLLDGEFTNGFKLADSNPGAYKALKDWTNFVAGVTPRLVSAGLERTAGRLNESLTYSILGASARAAGIQPTALVGTAAEIGPKYTAIGVKSLFSSSARRFALKHSHTLVGRQYEVAVADLHRGIKKGFGRVRQKAGIASLKGLGMLDMETAMATWTGAYRRGREVLKIPHGKAVRYADDTVTRTQASAAPHDLSPIQRNTLGKSVTKFQTFIINNWGFLTRDCLGMGNASINNADAFKKVFRYMVGAEGVNLLYEDVFHVRSPFPDPVHAFTESMDKHGDVSKAILSTAREGTEEIPIIGGGMRYGSSPLGAVAQWLNDVARSASGRTSTVKSIETAARGIGVPGTAQAYRAYRDVKK